MVNFISNKVINIRYIKKQRKSLIFKCRQYKQLLLNLKVKIIVCNNHFPLYYNLWSWSTWLLNVSNITEQFPKFLRNFQSIEIHCSFIDTYVHFGREILNEREIPNLGTADAICSLTLYATVGYTLLHHSAIQ